MLTRLAVGFEQNCSSHLAITLEVPPVFLLEIQLRNFTYIYCQPYTIIRVVTCQEHDVREFWLCYNRTNG